MARGIFAAPSVTRRVRPPDRQQCTTHSASERQHQSFGEELPHESRRPSTKRGAWRPRSRGPSSAPAPVGNVGTRRREHEPTAPSSIQASADRVDHFFGQGLTGDTRVFA